MCFLHKSSIGCHGDLRSSKCVIDSRWVCKIADFGLEKFKGGQKANSDIGLDAEYHRKYSPAFSLLQPNYGVPP